MPILAMPLALLGLLTLPAVAAIYLLRNRSRRVTVSSLMLWTDQRRAREGGVQVQRIQTPLLLLLELLALAMLALAASDPRIQRDEARRPLVVVLDDSYSMLAKQSPGTAQETTARARAEKALSDLLDDEGDTPVQLVLAGGQPQLIGRRTTSPQQVIGQLKDWTCGSRQARLVEGVAMALAVGGSQCRVLVLTDHPRGDQMLPELPAGRPEGTEAPDRGGRLLWRALGQAEPNLAIVSASRTAVDPGEADADTPRRVLLEVANLWDHPRAAQLTVEGLDDSDTADIRTLQLSAREVRRVDMLVTGTPRLVRIRLSDDALALDNRVVLLPQVRRAVRVRVDIADRLLREAVTRALEAADSALIVSDRPAIVFTDGPGGVESGAWAVRFIVEPQPAAYAGPYVLDRAHDLVEGLDLSGVIWGAGKAATLPGRPVVTVGNVPLISDAQRPSGVHELRIRLNPAMSTLIDSPNWPILIWNLLRLRADDLPAVQRTNVRLGTDALLRVGPGVAELAIREPDGRERTTTVRDRTVTIPARAVGVYTVTAGEQTWQFAANALYQDESDVSRTDTAESGSWINDTILQTEYRSVAWVCLLVALAALVAHMALMASRPGGTRL